MLRGDANEDCRRPAETSQTPLIKLFVMESLSRDGNGFHGVELRRHRERNRTRYLSTPRIGNGLLGFRVKVSGKSHGDSSANSPRSTRPATAFVAAASCALCGGALGIR